MSRIPQPSSRRPPSKPSPSLTVSTAGPRSKTPSTSSPTPTLRSQASLKSLRPSRSPVPPKSPVRRTAAVADDTPSQKPQLSIREQIALKRAEAKKAQSATSRNDGLDKFATLEDALPTVGKKQNEDEVDLGRWSVKETIERARNSGTLNLAARALPCLPSALFEIHLGIKPEPLKSVPNEPPITTSSTDDITTTRRKANSSNAPSWYEAQDLTILKAWSNEIVEIQPELSMFGSLKTVDLHNNHLASLPDSFADLTALTLLDLSHNALTSLPANIFALPNLTTLNISHNELTSLPFRAPFDVPGSNPIARTKDSRGDWFSQSIARATSPLPRLITLNASHNRLTASAIDHSQSSAQSPPSLPSQLAKLDLSANPLGQCTSLIQALAQLERLRELRLEQADIANDSFPVDILSSLDSDASFRVLKLLDLGETHVTAPAIEAAFRPPVVVQELEFEVMNEEPREGVLRVILGKKVIKEAWEVEAERRAKLKAVRNAGAAVEEGLSFGDRTGATGQAPAKTVAAKEPWKIEAEQGLLTEGAKRRARAAAATAQASALSVASTSTPGSPRKKPTVVEKERWEIEAEQGLLTEGAKRRARAAAAAAANSASPAEQRGPSPAASTRDTPAASPTLPSIGSILSNPKFYDSTTQKLTLPPSTAPSKAAHARSFSYAPASLAGSKSSKGESSNSDLALAIPTPSLPLSAIAAQPLAHTLKILLLTNRRKDPTFSLPAQDGVFLPNLEELSLEGCNLPDSVPVSRASATPDSADEFSTPRTSEPILLLIARLFPSIKTLDLSYNNLTSGALFKDALASLILASATDEEGSNSPQARKGLRHLRLRGNRINELDGFQGVAEIFKGNRECPSWKLEELDLRDNEIGKLPPELGLMPLDVFLVDGNVFRIPQRRVWEREGTKGLLSWLRGRIE